MWIYFSIIRNHQFLEFYKNPGAQRLREAWEQRYVFHIRGKVNRRKLKDGIFKGAWRLSLECTEVSSLSRRRKKVVSYIKKSHERRERGMFHFRNIK